MTWIGWQIHGSPQWRKKPFYWRSLLHTASKSTLQLCLKNNTFVEANCAAEVMHTISSCQDKDLELKIAIALLPMVYMTSPLKICNRTLQICIDLIPLVVAYKYNQTLSRICVVVGRRSLEKMSDSGPMQHNLLQETLKEGGGIPKQEILLLS